MNTQPRRKVDKRRIVLLDKTREGNRYKTRQVKPRLESVKYWFTVRDLYNNLFDPDH